MSFRPLPNRFTQVRDLLALMEPILLALGAERVTVRRLEPGEDTLVQEITCRSRREWREVDRALSKSRPLAALFVLVDEACDPLSPGEFSVSGIAAVKPLRLSREDAEACLGGRGL